MPAVGVEVEPQPWMRSGPSRAQAVFAIAVAPAGRRLAMRTAKWRVTLWPARMLPTARRQREPGPVAGQNHPAELAPASKVVLSGTTSEIWMPPMPTLAWLVTVMA